MLYEFYVAGPLFNSAQIAMLSMIEALMSEYDRSYYSPRLHAGILDPNDPGSAARIFQNNIDAMDESERVLAVLDYRLPETRVVLAVDTETKQANYLQLPDTGTVWEMGYVYRANVPIIGVCMDNPKCVNIMLARSMVGMITSEHALRKYIETMDTAFLTRWRGPME